MGADLGVLEAALGYAFESRVNLVRALTHRSRTHEQTRPGEDPISNEQLEFLGDSILGFVVSEYLFRRFPLDPEGRLSKVKAHLVSEARLYEVARALNVGDHLILGRGEEMSGGRTKKALLADGIEALIAAIYLDGGMAAAQQFIETRIIGQAGIDDQMADLTLMDYKGVLQQRAQSLGLPVPKYSTVGETGPEHAKVFTVEVRMGENLAARAQGLTKKAAQQKAAQLVLSDLGPQPA